MASQSFYLESKNSQNCHWAGQILQNMYRMGSGTSGTNNYFIPDKSNEREWLALQFPFPYTVLLQAQQRAIGSVVEHSLHTGGVTSSNLVSPTIFPFKPYNGVK
jgi:hypothetical protein